MNKHIELLDKLDDIQRSNRNLLTDYITLFYAFIAAKELIEHIPNHDGTKDMSGAWIRYQHELKKVEDRKVLSE